MTVVKIKIKNIKRSKIKPKVDYDKLEDKDIKNKISLKINKTTTTLRIPGRFSMINSSIVELGNIS